MCLCLAWYIRELLKRFRYLSDNSFILREKVERYREHLSAVYELPTFYGDETLKGLLEHAKETSDFLSRYEEVYSFTQPDLLEQLEAASKELEEKYEQEEAASEEE